MKQDQPQDRPNAFDLYDMGEALEKKSWIPLICTIVGFVNMFFAMHLIENVTYRMLLLPSWVYPLVLSMYISSKGIGMQRTAIKRWGSDDEGTDF